jgi:hypothetical protein
MQRLDSELQAKRFSVGNQHERRHRIAVGPTVDLAGSTRAMLRAGGPHRPHASMRTGA